MTTTTAHILGPGGAGKSTVGALLSTNFGIPVVDLDIYFIENVGDISHFIRTHGYVAYARKNVLNYRAIIEKNSRPNGRCAFVRFHDLPF
ncbi:shikimate kinase [Pseudomonas sp.]|uniref:shikimate kinase n=1 Tax=Pseudomonas sp. TaxID=306 RepID=UPI003C740AF8